MENNTSNTNRQANTQPYPQPSRQPQVNITSNSDPERDKFIQTMKAMSHYKRQIHDKRDLKINPHGISIEGQKRNEKIFLYMRRHWSENISWIVRNFFYAFIPLIFAIILNLLGIDNIEFVTVREVFIVLVVYYSLIVTNVIKDFFDWYFDPYIITNERIIHYEFNPFTKYIVQESMLESIQKIQEVAGGVISNAFGYGTLIISIEGPQETIVMKNIPEATKVRTIISDLSKIAKQYGYRR